MQGILLKGIGGFYYVETDDGIYECKARGAFRKEKISPLAGDQVVFEQTEQGKGLITQILPRKNEWLRPPVANLDQLMLVVSACEPAPNPLIMDKLITLAEYKNIEPLIVFTKIDLADVCALQEIYQKAGYRTLALNNFEHAHVNALKEMLSGKMTMLTGNSGVGKSSLLNNVFTDLNLETSAISQKLGRGRHTTRHVEFYPLDTGGYVADTPGFSSIEMYQYEVIKKEQLQYCFREISPYLDKCRFHDCAHVAEKGCAVLQAVAEGEISKQRHESYIEIYNEAKSRKDWELK